MIDFRNGKIVAIEDDAAPEMAAEFDKYTLARLAKLYIEDIIREQSEEADSFELKFDSLANKVIFNSEISEKYSNEISSDFGMLIDLFHDNVEILKDDLKNALLLIQRIMNKC